MVQKKTTPKAKPMRKAAQQKSAQQAIREDKKAAPSRSKSPKVHTVSKLVLLPVEPYLVHAFWEIYPPDLTKAKKQIKGKKDQASAFLRFYDVTGITPDKEKAHHTFDVQIDPNANNWYVRLWSAGRSYYAELGFKVDDESFVFLTRSNRVDMPADRPAQPTEEHIPINSAKKDPMQMATRQQPYHQMQRPESPPFYHIEHGLEPKGKSSISDLKDSRHTMDLAEMNEKEFKHGISSIIPTEK